MKREGYEEIIEEAWNSSVHIPRAHGVSKKIQNCRVDLLKWKHVHVGQIPVKIETLKGKLENIKENGIIEISRQQAQGVETELNNLLDMEETYCR